MRDAKRDNTPRPALQLFDGGERHEPAPPALSADMTLSEFFGVFFRPVWLAGRRADRLTHRAHGESIDWWVRLTGDPPLRQIDDCTAARFLVELAAQPGRGGRPLSDHTLAKHRRHLQTVLDLTGPRGKTCRRGQKLLAEPPYLEPVAVETVVAKGHFSVPQIERIVRATRIMTTPRVDGVQAPDWWRAIIITAYYTGLRIGTLRRLEFAWLIGEQLRIPGAAAKQKKSQTQFVHPRALEAIQNIRTARRLIFECSHGSWWIDKLHRRIQAAAGLAECDRWGWHGYRRAHATDLAMIDVEAARLSLNHSQLETTRRHYIAPRVTKRAIKKLPELRTGDDPQMRLLF